MSYKYILVFVSVVFAASIAFSPSWAGDLSGQKGKIRAMGQYPDGGCGKLFDRYIAASGHSAYATTVTGQYSAAVCGIALNKRSQEQAAQDAVKVCESGNEHYKVEQLGGCYVGASK